MSDQIKDAPAYFERRMSELHGSESVLLLIDPFGILDLNDEYISPIGKRWMVLEYSGNDIAFRKRYSTDVIVWAKQDDLTFIPDILERADKIIDMRLTSILKEFCNDDWTDIISEYSDIIYKNLGTFLDKYKELRKETKIPLSKNMIRALVVACESPDVPISDLISWSGDKASIISRYLKIAWSYKIKKIEILNGIIKESVDKKWLDKDPGELAVYFYIYDIFERYSVQNPKYLIRGLDIVSFDPDEVEDIDAVFAKVREFASGVAEDVISREEMRRVIRCIPSEDEWMQDAFFKERPIFVSALALEILEKLVDGGIKPIAAQAIIISPHYRDDRAKNELEILYNIIAVEEILSKDFDRKNGIPQLMDWYLSSRAYLMELFLARTYQQFKHIDDRDLQRKATTYIENLSRKVRNYLEKADQNLADIIDKNIDDYFMSPRLATHILRSAKKMTQKRLWVLVFDGMRFDTWDSVVKPIIQTKFEITEEKTYLCLLPSVTEISRKALFAGATPDRWSDYNGNYTDKEYNLVQKMLNLSISERRTRLNFVTQGESDISQKKIDDVRDYNIIVYNLSDDWIHSRKSNIADLNDEIKQMLTNNILPDLERIEDGDDVIITSDHGFIELFEEDMVRISSILDINQQVYYRYLKNISYPEGVKISYDTKEFYIIAKGRKWFNRGGKFDRYSHGGISLAEMVVPGAHLKKITIPRVSLRLDTPESVSVKEDKMLRIIARVINDGNKPCDFEICFKTDKREERRMMGSLSPNDEEKFVFETMATLDLASVVCILSYPDINKKQEERKKLIRVIVEKRKDKVELDLGALDLLEDKS